MAVIEYKDVSFSYPTGNQALWDINFSVEANESLAIIGQNGAGKTTMIKMVNGLLIPKQGEVHLMGENNRGKTTAQMAHTVGFVFQNPRTQLFLGSVNEEVAFGPKNLKVKGGDLEDRIVHALELTGLLEKRTLHPYDLNPAERKLLTIASIISMQPRILILDEPTGGLDCRSVERVIQVIEYFKTHDCTVIAVTHDMNLVARCFSRVLLMRKGHLACDGEVHEVFSQHKMLEEAYVRSTLTSQLAACCDLPKTLITVEEMATYLKV